MTNALIEDHFHFALPSHLRNTWPRAPFTHAHKLELCDLLPFEEQLAAYLERPGGNRHITHILLVEHFFEAFGREAERNGLLAAVQHLGAQQVTQRRRNTAHK